MKEENNNNYLSYGLCFGPLIGITLGYVIGYNPLQGIIYGQLAGVTIALLFKHFKTRHKQDDDMDT